MPKNTLDSLLKLEAPENPLLEIIEDPIAAITISDALRGPVLNLLRQIETKK
ncbi:hypothetical protein HOG17_01815 [Candidatus Peregrinibacteria bacterium]|nr:hypothetical protein [Candidatus Peregrinibacteria bacterium]MBT4148094.1 hypothetical protein [Candidatus Peregrinibacteria bacterium]MBT4365858.1 hypothetical protein [Candidatus Peregrinibacteria bacterium]MBT4456452.1 hypothetical protein [Candidatus Peregrinibacteria bacterium]